MDRLDAMRLFARIVERRSFGLAAQDFGLPASTASDAVKQIEARLGVRLLERTTRQVSSTPDGDAYYQRCLAILADVEDAESMLTGAKPQGFLHVDVQGNMARRVLMPGLPRFLAEYPGIDLFMSEGDRFVDLVREGVDCVLRSGELKDSSDIIARPLGLLQEVTCCSPSYIERFGRPRRWDALDGHRMIGFRSSATGGVLPLEFMVNGERKTVLLPISFSVNGADSYRAACAQGLGLIQVPRYAVREELAAGTLIAVLTRTPPSPTPVSLLYPRNRQRSPRVRVFLDWVVRETAAVAAAL